MKWFFSKIGSHIHAEAPDGTKYDVPDGKMDGYLGSVLLNAMAKALANPPEVPLLTDDEAYAIYEQEMGDCFTDAKHCWVTGIGAAFARAIEQAVRQKAGPL